MTNRFKACMLLLLLISAGFLPSISTAQTQFGLPFKSPPGPSTWYVSQLYGHTVWAHRNWQDLYAAGQGLHFGIDFAAPCGTEVVAIGDGVIFAVDGPYGSAPHNVVVDHGNGLLSLYGHLQVRSSVTAGQPVARGDVVGHSGDPASPACNRAPHLHLEIRRAGMGSAVNPVPLIDADWRALTIGADTDGAGFVMAYDQPGMWVDQYQQPDVTFGGPRLNDKADVWPPR